jgi:hypothetical protein
MMNGSEPVLGKSQEREKSGQQGTGGSSIMQGINLASQTQHSRNHVFGSNKHGNSNSQGHPSLSGAVLSSLGGGTFVQSDRREEKKKSKKHKHDRDDKDKSRHSSSRKKRRDSNSIVQSSKIALATAENSFRRNLDQHGSGHSSRSNRDSSSLTIQSVDQSSAQFFNGAGQAFSMPSQFHLNSRQPIHFSSSGGAITSGISTANPNSTVMPLTLSGMSARDGAHQELFSRTPGFSGHYAQPSTTQFQENPFPISYSNPQLTEQQFKLHSEANGSRTDGVLQICHVSDHVTIDNNLVSVAGSRMIGDSSIATASKETSASRICDQNTVTNVSIDDLRALFHLTLVEASKRLGMCTTLFKKICRKKNIEKWPYRKIHSLMNKVDSLKNYLSDGNADISDSVKISYKEQIEKIMEKVNDIKQNTGSSAQRSDTSEGESSNADFPGGSVTSNDNFEKVKNSIDTNSVTSSESVDSAAKRRRCKTSYDYKTGWVANCSTCGKLGKYRHPTQGRVFQHSSGTGKYCGYFRDNPRREEDQLNVPEFNSNNATEGSSTMNSAADVISLGRKEVTTVHAVDSNSVRSDNSGVQSNNEVVQF